MFIRKPRYSSEEFARRGGALYENKIRALVEADNHGRILAIDIESGEYAVAEEGIDASRPLIEKNPDAQIWCLRIGYVAVDRLGGTSIRDKR